MSPVWFKKPEPPKPTDNSDSPVKITDGTRPSKDEWKGKGGRGDAKD